MAKRNLYLNLNSEHIVGKVKNKGYSSISDYVNESILNNYIPCYIEEFRVEALLLLDLLTESDINITGKTIVLKNKDRINKVVDDAFGRSILWLKSHHIKNNDALVDIFDNYVEENDDLFLKKLNDWYSEPLYKFVKNKIEAIINDEVPDSLILIAKLILKNWIHFKDDDRSYEFLALVIFNSKRSNDFVVEKLFIILQKLEAIVLYELIN